VDEDPPIGNGRAMSVLFAREGATVACIDVNKEAADDTVAQITSEGGKAFADIVDVADASATAPSVERCAKKLGGLDGLALNVGISSGLSLPKMTAEAWDKDFAVNVRSHMLFAQKALEVMAPGGAIVLMSSMASQRDNGRNPAYESSKAAQIALGRAIARAGEDKGIRCNVIAPGFMDTPMGRDASRRRADRAVEGLVPSPLAIEYYGQRASAGLLVTEASQVSQQGQGYQDTPGIYSKEQVAGWRKVTKRVHERGGRIFIQIWHVGRISHTSLQ